MKRITCPDCMGRGERHCGSDYARAYDLVQCETCKGTGLIKAVNKTKTRTKRKTHHAKH